MTLLLEPNVLHVNAAGTRTIADFYLRHTAIIPQVRKPAFDLSGAAQAPADDPKSGKPRHHQPERGVETATDPSAQQSHRNDALAGDDSVERDDLRPRRARTTRGAPGNDAREPLDLSSQPELALSAGRTETPSEQPDRHADAAAFGEAMVPLSGLAPTALDVASRGQARLGNG
jgi:hypothetical protein